MLPEKIDGKSGQKLTTGDENPALIGENTCCPLNALTDVRYMYYLKSPVSNQPGTGPAWTPDQHANILKILYPKLPDVDGADVQAMWIATTTPIMIGKMHTDLFKNDTARYIRLKTALEKYESQDRAAAPKPAAGLRPAPSSSGGKK